MMDFIGAVILVLACWTFAAVCAIALVSVNKRGSDE